MRSRNIEISLTKWKPRERIQYPSETLKVVYLAGPVAGEIFQFCSNAERDLLVRNKHKRVSVIPIQSFQICSELDLDLADLLLTVWEIRRRYPFLVVLSKNNIFQPVRSSEWVRRVN